MLGVFAEITSFNASLADEIETAFRVESAGIYRSWVDEIAADTGQGVKVKDGTFIVANSVGKDDDENISAIHRATVKFSQPSEWVEPADVPSLKAHRSLKPRRALFLPREGFIDSTEIMQALRNANDRIAPGLHVQDEVTSILVRNGRAEGVTTASGSHYKAAAIVLCCGQNINRILDASGLRDLGIPKIVGGKGASLMVRSEVAMPCVIRTPNRDFACGTHVVPRSNGELYVGATNRISETPGVGQSVTAGELHTQLHSVIHEINTSFRVAAVTCFRFGTRPLCVDGYPIVGKTQLDGLMVATGTYRTGMLMAPLIARIVGADIAGEQGPANPFSPDNRDILLSKRSSRDVIESGVRDMMSVVQEPHGFLPYNRTQELGDLITVLLKYALEDNGEYDEFMKIIGDDFRCNKMPERIPSLLYSIHEHCENKRKNR